MNQHDHQFSPAERDQLEQELLELHFGCHEDPVRLQARLDAEPALRALRRDVLQKAQLLEAAVRPEQPRLDLPVPPPARRSRLRLLRSPATRLLGAAAIAAATVLGFFAAERFAASRWSRHQQDHLHLTVSAPKAVPAGAPWNFTVQAQDLHGAPAACRVRWQSFGAANAVLAAGEVPLTNGTATVTLSADLRVPQRVEVVASHATDEVRQVLTLSTAAAGPLVHVTTDRPVYRPAETVFVRAVVLDRATLRPLAAPSQLLARLLDAKGSPVATAHEPGSPEGVAVFVFALPRDSAGGPHRIEVSTPDQAFPPESVEVLVRSFQAPQLKKTIVLDRTTYAPGGRGSAALTVERLGGGFAAGAAAKATLVVDGTEVWTEQQPVDERGQARFRFVVPVDVKEGAARFVATITDGGIVETEVKPFVVPTGKVLVAGFPEGGELVAGVENGLYLECTDPLGRPVDAVGELIDERGQQVERFRATHQGRVKLTFVPREGSSYRVRLVGQPEPFALSAVHARGIALRLPGGDVAANAPLRLDVAGRGDGPWLLGVFCRGVLVGQTTLRPDERGELRARAEVPLPASAAGVLRATVFDRNLQPVAERLVRRAAAQRIDVELLAQRKELLPGEPQQITVRTRDEQGRAVAAVVGLCVTDLAVTSLGSEPRVGLADHAMLFADVERIEDLGDFLPGHAEASRNVDLLLGTRGWRRFVWRNDAAAQQRLAEMGPKAAGVLAREGFSHTPQVLSNLQAAQASGAELARSASRAERSLGSSAAVAAGALFALVLLEGLFALLRLARSRTEWILGLVTAVAVLCLVPLALVPDLGSQFKAEGAAPMAAAEVDFDAEGDARLYRLALPFDLGARGGADPMVEEERKLHLAAAVVRDQFLPAAQVPADVPPAAGLVAADDFYLAARWRSARSFRERVYAHRHTMHEGRTDFTPTIYWHGHVATGELGESTVSFATSDAVTTWLVQADAHGAAGDVGRVGQGEARFQSRLPFHLDCKLPDEVSAGDQLLLPIAAVVEGAEFAEVALRVQCGAGLQVAGEAPLRIALQDGRGRTLLPIAVDDSTASTTLLIEGTAGNFTDRVRHTLRIAPRGFPHQRSAGGTVAADAPATVAVAIPADALPGSGRVAFKLFPSPLTALTEGLQGILQEPHGCFEQASSSNYPNTLVLTLLDASGDDVPSIAARARELLPRGYGKITSYECKERGYEWFGGDPGHEALTAYGLLQFHDMAKVHDVDAGMVARTRAWLLARRDGKGGYQRNAKALDRFGGSPQPITDAYVTYALLQSGSKPTDLAKEVEALVGRMATKDPYELALISCALHLAGRPEAGLTRQWLTELQQPDGSLHGTTSSITSSGGRDLIVETTGFAVLAWLPDAAHQASVRRAVDFLQGSRSASGTFGATQATIAALRAMTAYAQANRTMQKPGTLRILEGERVLAERAFGADEVDAITFDLWSQLAPGPHTLRIELQGGATALPWACDVGYHAEQPADDPSAQVAIRTSLRAARVVEGSTVALDVAVENRTAAGLPMTMAIVGLPAGLDVPTRVLEDLQKAGAFGFWELRGRELALYWRDLAPEATAKVTLDLVARVPGRSRGPASRTYLYYTPQQKHWSAPLQVEVTAAR